MLLISPFSKATVSPSATVTNNLRFPGQYYDAETGMHDNWHRYYDPDSGRYNTPDPIGLAGGINLYSYTSNNPTNYIDPWGLAQFGYRPLDSIGFIPPYGVNAFDDKHNTEWVHEQLWFDDAARNPNLRTNIGFFGDNGMLNEPGIVREDTGHTRDDYTFRRPIYDDDIMRKALRNLESRWDGGNYNVATDNNCQDFSDALRQEYFRLGGTVVLPTP